MLLGYNTNGLAHHRWDDALRLLAAVGYESVAITIDHHCLDPHSPRWGADIAAMRDLLQQLGLRCVIETGARFLLDPRRKHQPTLLSSQAEDRQQRQDFLRAAIDIASELSADVVSFWSGTPLEADDPEVHWTRLISGCRELLDYAVLRDVRLAFEPEPGMFIETMDQFTRLCESLNHPLFGLTLDVGHVHCLGDGDLPGHIRRWAKKLWNIHLEDMHPGVHEHLRFGEGSIDFPPIFQALAELDYDGGVHIELSRHSHLAPTVINESYQLLTGWRTAARSK
jgi:L-ribulose-5-phosphate 3-epimerase